jgi:hypothetical protein
MSTVAVPVPVSAWRGRAVLLCGGHLGWEVPRRLSTIRLGTSCPCSIRGLAALMVQPAEDRLSSEPAETLDQPMA